MNVAKATRIALTIADMKNERLMAFIAFLSVGRRRVRKIPSTAVSTPIAGTMRGKINPLSPKPARPRISAATRVTA